MSFRHRPLMTSVYEWHCSHACTSALVMGRMLDLPSVIELTPCKYKRVYFYFGVQTDLTWGRFDWKSYVAPCWQIEIKAVERPECIQCNSSYSLKHVLLDCVDVADVRQTFYNSLYNIFTNVAGDTIFKGDWFVY